MNSPRLTIRDISRMWNEAIRQGAPLPLWLLGDLLDDFRQRCSGPEEKLALVHEPPVWLDVETHADCNAYLAAVTETLWRKAGQAPEFRMQGEVYFRQSKRLGTVAKCAS